MVDELDKKLQALERGDRLCFICFVLWICGVAGFVVAFYAEWF
jgi:hypothetical protein